MRAKFCLMVASVAAFGMTSAGWAAPPGDDGRTGKLRARDQVVTLVTGDRVTLLAGDSRQLSVVPGEGRRGIGFGIQKAGGKLYVVPADVAPLVASGRLDRQLFDITGLIEAGYDDSRSRSIPLIVTYDGVAGRGSVRSSGAELVRELPSINGSAVRVVKGRGFGLMGAGVERVWLDGKRRTVLDQSVPQIGTPAAWQAGYTGRGVTVAVLDTGVDATHPDLADRVVEAKNFTEGPAGDQVGHGTHVASTIAGTAAASAGKYKGVASDATILDGKVCEDFGCYVSAILAGMEWAASEKKADVINLSLGGGDGPGIDPLEEAVNTLTAQTGALFVIAAGNDGPGPGSVNSPGSADAALSVGAVDKSDEIADFSGRGPRVGDGAVKPDITAPGVDIVAARAAGTLDDEAVGEHYARLSGTSMATPHTAGAAALLAQQHPDWAAGELKAALMSSAKPHADQTAFEQGAGRVDVARAITQTVVSEPGSVSFGTALWPHNDDVPVAKQVTYRNRGSNAVTLNLRSTITGPDGQPAPAGALSLSASSVTVPAGGTATVTVTSNTNHDGPDGAYSGRITATGPGGESVTTPFAVDREVESYDLTVSHIGPDGEPAPAGSADYFGLDSHQIGVIGDEDGTATIRLRTGRYFVVGFNTVPRSENAFDIHNFIQPMLRLDQDTTLTMDARRTRQVRTTLPRPEAKLNFQTALATLETGGTVVVGGVGGGTEDRIFTAPLGGPVAAPDRLTASLASHWGVPGADGSFSNTPYMYGLVDTQPGRYWHGFDRLVKDSQLAKVKAQHNAQAAHRQASKYVTGFAPGIGFAVTPPFVYDLPSRPTHYLEPGEVTWSTRFREFALDQDGFAVFQTDMFGPERTYRAGRVYAERWNAAVFGPRFANDGFAYRAGDFLTVNVPMYSDQDGNVGFSRTNAASTKLYRNGVLIGESPYDAFVEVDDVAAAPGDFKLVSTATRPGYSKFSTTTKAEWTFKSETAIEDGEMLPLWAVRYFPAVDNRNVVKRQPVTVLPVKLETQPGAKPGSLTNVEVRVSGDDGTTWTKAAVRRTGVNRYVAVFVTPAGGSVSLKAKAADSDGNTTEQTIIRAYALR